ncbi:hypothetical protein [Roseateles microcysteis]|uniref:hypothetical protein n=1 Tax=Roseateles microcysteis TaxID=3119057 RepID=UPI002FE66ED8
MSSVETLIAAAEEKFGSRRKLADAISENHSFLGRIARGEKQLSPNIAAKLAEVAGLDPREAALAAIVSQEKDPAERERMARLFGMPAKVAACVVAALIAFPSNEAAANPNSYVTDRVCIM